MLLDEARQVLRWERGDALTEARESGSSEAELARELGVQPSVVRDLLAEHRRAAAGRRPASRSRVARQLAQRLTDRTGVQVEIRWDSSGASSRTRGRWAYHLDWPAGPTRAAMRELVDQVLPEVAGDPPALDRGELVYVRTMPPAAVALAMIANVQRGGPALGGHRHAHALEQALEEVDHPERGTAEAQELAGRLGRLTGWDTDRMAALLDGRGLAALTGDLGPDPDGTVVPLIRPSRAEP